MTMSNDNGKPGLSTWARSVTHAFKEMLSPSLVLPRQLRRALQPDKEFPLEIKKLVEIGEEKVDCILVNDVQS